MTNRQWALSVLGLNPEATESDIRIAYRDLVSVWHPDRHQDNERVRRKAEEMLKRINAARDILVGGGGSADGWECEPGDIPNTDDDEEFLDSESNDIQEPGPIASKGVFARFILPGLICSITVFGLYGAFTAPRSKTSDSISNTQEDSRNIQIVNSAANMPKNEESNSSRKNESSTKPIDDTSLSIVPSKVPEELPYLKSLVLNEGDSGYGVAGTTTVRARVYASTGEILCRLEAGTPVRVDSTSAIDWLSIALPSGVRGFIRSKQVKTLKVLTKNDVSHSSEDKVSEEGQSSNRVTTSFTLGSTMEEVKSVQGTPTSVRPGRWDYEYSSVEFDSKGKVSAYSNISKNLKVAMISKSTETTKTVFSIGSTKDEVLLVQGTPTSVRPGRWDYEYSSVEFDSKGKVSAYSNISKNLKVAMISKSTETTKTVFSIGSTKDEVLLVQGTPTSVRPGRWDYEYSSVEFDSKGKVSAYSNISKNLKVE
jgi:outer membrane protein assembly factor BamE (lipoprotein component of BamABCDE complex)